MAENAAQPGPQLLFLSASPSRPTRGPHRRTSSAAESADAPDEHWIPCYLDNYSIIMTLHPTLYHN